MRKSRDVDTRRRRGGAIGTGLPVVATLVEGRADEHLAFKVLKRTLALHLFDHYRDGRIAPRSKAPPGEQGLLAGKAPKGYSAPPYLGPRGRVGVRLERPIE